MYTTSEPIPILLGQIIDEMRETGVITSITVISGNSIIDTANDLREREYVTIGSNDYRIYNVTSDQFSVIGDVTGETEWKAKAPYYEYGHMLEIAQTLGEKDTSERLKYQKYPLIALKLDLPEDRQEITSVKVNPTIYLIHHTEGEYYAKDRLNNVFIPILDPLHEKFIDALTNSTLLNNERQIEHNSERRYYWGNVLPQWNDKVQMNDKIDAIELNGMELQFAMTSCYD